MLCPSKARHSIFPCPRNVILVGIRLPALMDRLTVMVELNLRTHLLHQLTARLLGRICILNNTTCNVILLKLFYWISPVLDIHQVCELRIHLDRLHLHRTRIGGHPLVVDPSFKALLYRAPCLSFKCRVPTDYSDLQPYLEGILCPVPLLKALLWLSAKMERTKRTIKVDHLVGYLILGCPFPHLTRWIHD